jgi:hypothetical protein
MFHGGPFEIEYSRFILGDVAVPRRLYLVIFSLLVVALAAAGLYLRQRAIAAAQEAATCETPALPPPPATPPPKLPGFELEAGCGPAGVPPVPATPAKTAPAPSR